MFQIKGVVLHYCLGVVVIVLHIPVKLPRLVAAHVATESQWLWSVGSNTAALA